MLPVGTMVGAGRLSPAVGSIGAANCDPATVLTASPKLGARGDDGADADDVIAVGGADDVSMVGGADNAIAVGGMDDAIDVGGVDDTIDVRGTDDTIDAGGTADSEEMDKDSDSAFEDMEGGVKGWLSLRFDVAEAGMLTSRGTLAWLSYAESHESHSLPSRCFQYVVPVSKPRTTNSTSARDLMSLGQHSTRSGQPRISTWWLRVMLRSKFVYIMRGIGGRRFSMISKSEIDVK